MSQTIITTPADMITALDNHDWWACMGGSNEIQAAKTVMANLRDVVANDATLQATFDAYIEYKRGERDEKPTADQFTVTPTKELVGTQGTVAANDATYSPSPTEPVSMAFSRDNVTALVGTGLIFWVQFVKRTTGEIRNMQCRVKVRKHLKGGPAAYSAKDKNLLFVYDMKAKGYRSVPIEKIIRMKVQGTTYQRAC